MKFYNMQQLIAKKADINFAIGGRCSGKSYAMAKFLLEHWLETGKEFVRAVRNWLFMDGIANYFDEVIYNEDLPVEVTYEKNRYLIRKTDEDGKAVGEKKVFGYAIPLTFEQKKKSNQFPNVDIMFMEEFVASSALDYADGSAAAEIAHLMSLISTVIRKRNGVRLFFIGNNMDVSNPYFEHFGVNVEKLKLGKIVQFQQDYEMNGKTIKGAKIAVEFVPIGWSNVDEIPVLLRIKGNDIATTGETASQKDVLEKAVQFYSDGEQVVGFTIDASLNLYCPLIACWSHYRGNPFGELNDGSYSDDKFRRYLTVTDYNGNCLIAEIPEPEDLPLAGEETLDLLFPLDCKSRLNLVNGDVETAWGTEIKAVFFNDMLTRYDYVTDRLEIVEQQGLAKRIGFGTCPRSETVKDYVDYMQAKGIAGYAKRTAKDSLGSCMMAKLLNYAGENSSKVLDKSD